MRRLQLFNGVAVLVCAAMAVAVMGHDRPTARGTGPERADPAQLRYAELGNGERGLVDATGHIVAPKRYTRIVAGSIVARSALGELCEPDRIVAVIEAGVEESPTAHRFAGVPRLTSVRDTELLLSLRADLVIINSVGSMAHVQRLRDAGLEVFALGEMRGVSSFIRDIHQVATLIGNPERGARLAGSFRRRIDAAAGDIPRTERKSGMYLSVYGAQIFGGTVGTSYHDILTYGGLVDAAENRFYGWPQYTAEHVLSADPEVIVAPSGVGSALCARSPLSRLRACKNHRAGIVELPAPWLEDPSMVMLDLAESIRETVYGAP